VFVNIAKAAKDEGVLQRTCNASAADQPEKHVGSANKAACLQPCSR